jgi:hypothetical protein
MPILCIGGRAVLDEAASAMLAAVLGKRGLGATSLSPEAIEPGHIASLATTEARLICLSYLGLGTSPAQIRYLVRRLRRILPNDVAILVAYWDEDDANAVRHLKETAEADAYATTLHGAVDLCIEVATGKLEVKANDGGAGAPNGKNRRNPTPRKPQTASA